MPEEPQSLGDIFTTILTTIQLVFNLLLLVMNGNSLER